MAEPGFVLVREQVQRRVPAPGDREAHAWTLLLSMCGIKSVNEHARHSSQYTRHSDLA